MSPASKTEGKKRRRKKSTKSTSTFRKKKKTMAAEVELEAAAAAAAASRSCPNSPSSSPSSSPTRPPPPPPPVADSPEPLVDPLSPPQETLVPPPPHPEAPDEDTLEPARPTSAFPDDDDEDDDDAEPPRSAPPPSPDLPASTPHRPRRPSNKRRKSISTKQRAAAKQRLALLSADGFFRIVPFSAAAARASLDLAAHEALFRSLGLWDFAGLALDGDVRADLVVPLIANYDPPRRRSFVQDLRISVSRADLARALVLPVKKEKGSCAELGADDPARTMYSREGSVAAVMDFMSAFMLFQFQDDACILPQEIAAANRLVKEGQPYKVDWAGLIWMLVEKELLDASKTGVCHYASHLQCLMKHQQPRLFKEAEFKLEPVPEVEEVEAENPADVPLAEEEEDEDPEEGTEDDALRIRSSADDFRDVGVEKCGPGLSLELGRDLAVAEGFEQLKEGEEVRWLQEQDNEGPEHCMRPCNSNGARNMEFENICKPDEDGRGEDGYADNLPEKYAAFDRMSSFERLTSTDLLHVLDNDNSSYGQPVNPLLSSGDFLTMRIDSQKSMAVELNHDRSVFVENNGKRQIGEIDDEEDDEDAHQFAQNNRQKRMRTGAIWDGAVELDAILGQIELFAGKARMLCAEKEQGRMNAQLQLQYLSEVVQQKDRIIQSLEKTRMEEQQKWHVEACRYEHEISVMANLIIGYKKALKETRRAFTEYRKNYPQDIEPLYKDAGCGGLVLTAKELEMQRLEKEEEVRHTVVEIVDGFEKVWQQKLGNYASALVILCNRMVDLEENIKLLKGRFAKSGTSDG